MLMTHILERFDKLPIAFGGAAISGEGGGYGFGDISENDSIDLLKLAFELGIRLFDTAPIYGFGLSEVRIGKAFKANRDEVFIVSKSGVHWHENKRVDMTNDPKITQKMLEQSLRDLNSDYIDLYMIHWPDQKFDIRLTMEVLAKAKREGKIKHIGLCNTFPDDLKRAMEVEKIEALQSEFNFFSNKFVSEELFPIVKKENMSFMSWGTLDKGILTGRVDEKRKMYDKSDCRSWAPWWKDSDNSKKFEAMKKLWPVLDQNRHSGLSLALSFNFSFPELSVAICGARNRAQLESLIDGYKNRPTLDELKYYIELGHL